MIYFLRHGLDDERFIGGHSSVSLLEEGVKQVEYASKFLVSGNYQIKHIVSSDIKRALESAEIVSKYLDLDVTETSLLRELDKGEMNGMLKSIADKMYPLFSNVQDINLCYPGGESMTSFYKRIKKDLFSILALDNSLVVTHRGVINMIYTILNGDELTMNKEKYGVTHASIHECDPVLRKIKRIY